MGCLIINLFEYDMHKYCIRFEFTLTIIHNQFSNRQISKVHDMANRIVEGLQKAIFEHRLLPGTKLSEDEVGEVYGVSRTIVRSALQSLAHSQLVTIEKNRGAFIARPSIREAHEVFEARALIEPRTAAMAAKLIGNSDIELLNAHIDAEHSALEQGDKGRALALSGEFHLEIARIAAHDVFTDFVTTLVKRSSLIIALYWKRPDTTCESHAHHALKKAFQENNPKAAAELMRSHIIDLHSGLDLAQKELQPMSIADALRA